MNGDPGQNPPGFWSKTWPLLVIVIVTILGWYFLSKFALHARMQDPAGIATGPTVEDFTQGKVWATELLGLAATLAGFLGITKATQRTDLTAAAREQVAETSVAGLLVGATLLGVGGVAVPVGLATLVGGRTAFRLMQSWHGHR